MKPKFKKAFNLIAFGLLALAVLSLGIFIAVLGNVIGAVVAWVLILGFAYFALAILAWRVIFNTIQ